MSRLFLNQSGEFSDIIFSDTLSASCCLSSPSVYVAPLDGVPQVSETAHFFLILFSFCFSDWRTSINLSSS